MASAAAQKYFNSLPAAEQQRALQSWGGEDRMDEWFANAVNAGAVGPDGSPVRQQTNYAQEGFSQGYGGASGLRPGQTPTPAQLRAYAKERGWSEDFDRYGDSVLQDWLSRYWDPQRMGFRNEHYQAESGNQAFQGIFEKPIDLPEGYIQWGQGYISKDSPQYQQFAGGGGGAAGATGMAGGQQSLEDMIKGLMGQGINPYSGSPLVSMLQNQGGWLRQLDQNPGDGAAGVKGGALSNGTIWYQRTNPINPTRTGISFPTPVGKPVGAGGGMATDLTGTTIGGPAKAVGVVGGRATPTNPSRTGIAFPTPVQPPGGPGQVMNPLEGGALTNMMRNRQKRPNAWF